MQPAAGAILIEVHNPQYSILAGGLLTPPLPPNNHKSNIPGGFPLAAMSICFWSPVHQRVLPPRQMHTIPSGYWGDWKFHDRLEGSPMA
jgi:hypothetical protein